MPTDLDEASNRVPDQPRRAQVRTMTRRIHHYQLAVIAPGRNAIVNRREGDSVNLDRSELITEDRKYRLTQSE